MVSLDADLSAVMPVYNEAERMREGMRRVLGQDFVSEVFIVDDGSTDETWSSISEVNSVRVQAIKQVPNRGKGAAQRLRIFEVGVAYSVRTYAEGKKMNWRDGLRAVHVIARYSPVWYSTGRRFG